MIPFTETMTEGVAYLGYIAPSNHTNNTDNTVAGIDMSCIRRLMSILNIGILGTNANVQLYYQASANSNMAGASNVASSVPVTASTNGRIYTLEVRADQLPNGCRYVAPIMVVNTAASFAGLTCIGVSDSYSPANQYTIANTVTTSAVT